MQFGVPQAGEHEAAWSHYLKECPNWQETQKRCGNRLINWMAIVQQRDKDAPVCCYFIYYSVCARARVCVCACACVHGGVQRTISGIISLALSTFSPRHRLSWPGSSPNRRGLAGLQSPRIRLSLLPFHLWDYTASVFLGGFWGSNSGPYA